MAVIKINAIVIITVVVAFVTMDADRVPVCMSTIPMLEVDVACGQTL